MNKYDLLVKDIRKLHNKKGRKQLNSFIVEGKRGITEAIKNNADINKIFISENCIEEITEFCKNLNINKNIIYVVPEKYYKKISTTVSPQGIAAIIKNKEQDIYNIDNLENNLIVAVDSLQDPGNMGTIIRTSAAAKAAAVLIGKGSVDPFSPKVVRATMGSIFQLPVIVTDNIANIIEYLKYKKSFKIIVGDLRAEKYYFQVNLKGSTILIIGNENKGPSDQILEMADELIKIPLLGNTESLNAGVAAGILIYERVRQLFDCNN
jgi:TrmH family RNA methyltransferase